MSQEQEKPQILEVEQQQVEDAPPADVAEIITKE